jgi:hypothetical protein
MGLRSILVAHEPLTMDPVAIDWDASGKLWVVEMADYPLGLDGKGKVGGRVRVLEDLNQDGLRQAIVICRQAQFPNRNPHMARRSHCHRRS